jgi:hypothetical protein
MPRSVSGTTVTLAYLPPSLIAPRAGAPMPAVLTVVGIWGAGLPRRAKGVLLLPAVYFMVIHAASVSSMRYRLPAEPFMAILAVGGWRDKGGAHGGGE